MKKERTEFQSQVEDEGFKRASGYYTDGGEEGYQRAAFSGFCDGAEWQRNRVWHTFDTKPDLSKPVLLYDPQGNFMSPPVTCLFSFDNMFVRAMNKKYAAEYSLWAYMDDITPMKCEDLYSESNYVFERRRGLDYDRQI